MFLDNNVKVNLYDLVQAYNLLNAYIQSIKGACTNEQLNDYNKLLIRFNIKIKKAQAREHYHSDKPTYFKFMGLVADLEKQLLN